MHLQRRILFPAFSCVLCGPSDHNRAVALGSKRLFSKLRICFCLLALPAYQHSAGKRNKCLLIHQYLSVASQIFRYFYVLTDSLVCRLYSSFYLSLVERRCLERCWYSICFQVAYVIIILCNCRVTYKKRCLYENAMHAVGPTLFLHQQCASARYTAGALTNILSYNKKITTRYKTSQGI